VALLVELSGDGDDLLPGELAGGGDEGVLLVGEAQIEHGSSFCGPDSFATAATVSTANEGRRAS
jgi:hypothetical protein